MHSKTDTIFLTFHAVGREILPSFAANNAVGLLDLVSTKRLWRRQKSACTISQLIRNLHCLRRHHRRFNHRPLHALLAACHWGRIRMPPHPHSHRSGSAPRVPSPRAASSQTTPPASRAAAAITGSDRRPPSSFATASC
jgi:hypothetical protein